jgi:hypothetical protein
MRLVNKEGITAFMQYASCAACVYITHTPSSVSLPEVIQKIPGVTSTSQAKFLRVIRTWKNIHLRNPQALRDGSRETIPSLPKEHKPLQRHLLDVWRRVTLYHVDDFYVKRVFDESWRGWIETG